MRLFLSFLSLLILIFFSQSALAGEVSLGDACQATVDCVSGLSCKKGICAAPLVSYTTYKTLHLISILVLFMALGGAIFLSLAGSETRSTRILSMALHGVFALLILVGGFGLMARLGVSHKEGWPLWLKIKLGLWMMISLFVIVPRRLPKINRLIWPLVILLGSAAVWTAIHKPL